MKRKVASRRLKRRCIQCDGSFIKGDVYYVDRHVYKDDWEDKVIAYENTFCAKCIYKNNEREKRFEEFKKTCHHPFKDEVWRYIPGEAVMEPDYTECLLCGEVV